MDVTNENNSANQQITKFLFTFQSEFSAEIKAVSSNSKVCLKTEPKIAKKRTERKKHGRVVWMWNLIDNRGGDGDGHVRERECVYVCVSGIKISMFANHKNFHWNVSLFHVFKKFTLFRSKWTVNVGCFTSFHIVLCCCCCWWWCFFSILNFTALFGYSPITCTFYIRHTAIACYVNQLRALICYTPFILHWMHTLYFIYMRYFSTDSFPHAHIFPIHFTFDGSSAWCGGFLALFFYPSCS